MPVVRATINIGVIALKGTVVPGEYECAFSVIMEFESVCKLEIDFVVQQIELFHDLCM